MAPIDLSYLQELIDSIETASAAGKWPTVETDLTMVADQVAAVLRSRDRDAVQEAYGILEQAYSVLVTRSEPGPDAEVMNDACLAYALRSHTQLLQIEHSLRASPAEVIATLGSFDVQILGELLDAGDVGLGNNELARRLKKDESATAHRLPELREWGLIDSQRVGKATRNFLNEGVREALRASNRLIAAPAALGRHRTNREQARPTKARRNER